MRARAVLAIGMLALVGACSAPGDSGQAVANGVGGDPARGHDLMQKYGCGSCHMIPGVDGANGLVGPPLAGIASRSYIAGIMPNEPENMRSFIENPRGRDTLLAMPNLGVTHADARHITAYLYTLR